MSFLDLFSGTGRVAAAARSAGASIVTVELVRDRQRRIRQELGEDRHVSLCMDVRRAMNWLGKRDMRFEIIFADPPYELDWMKDLPRLLGEHRTLLVDGGVLIIERAVSEPLQLDGTPWYLADERKYGISVLDFLKLKEEKEEEDV